MARIRLFGGLLVVALLSNALAQDGLTCTNIGETWYHLCNTCSCRDGVTVCTMDRCSAHHSPISARACLAGSKWSDGCGQICVCDVSGKTRCTLGSCPPRVSPGQSLTFVKTSGDTCVAGDTWQVDCNTCNCVDGVAQCTKRRCPPAQLEPVERCQPEERWKDECGNLCHCTERGVISCTLLSCGPGQRAGAGRRPITRSGDSCQNEGQTWTQECNECDCNSGVVSCTRRLCAVTELPEKYGECQPGTRWVDECDNTCHCTPSGIPSCTLNECAHGRQEGERVHFLLEDGSSCRNEGEPWQQGCSTCECRAGRVSCSEPACPRAFAARLAVSDEPEWMRCSEGTTWEDECGNICSCWEEQPLCTRMGCPKGRVAGKPVKYFMFDGDECSNEGFSWNDDCNTCTCTDSVVSCTKQFCVKQRQSVRLVTPFLASTCTPGQRWVDECDNICFCPPSGHSACTMMACPPGKRPMVPVRYIHADGDACREEGASWRHECNTCRCRGGHVTCTTRPCPGVTRPLLQINLSPAGASADSNKQCEEGAEFTDECDNHCRCSGAGLLICTLKLCAPGKQAGRPQKKVPKAGEPCSAQISETWLDDCNTCQCVSGVTACTRVVCPRRRQQLDGVPVQQCRPGTSWVDECYNQCTCSDQGVSYCTLKACQHGQQYGTPKMFVQGVNDTCRDEGVTWKQDCNTCTCTEGRVSCTEDICEEKSNGVRARFSLPGPRCVAGSKWTDECGNTCRCTSSGQPACSLKACAPGKTAGVAVEQLPQAGDACSTEGQTWKEDCSKCTCTDGSVQCTDQICTPQALPASEEGPCTAGEEWIDECTNRCKCIQGEPRCTRRPCPQGGRPGVPVRFIVPDGESCDNEGDRWRDDCNTCRCNRGRVACTKKTCVGFERGGGDKKLGSCPFVPPGTLGVCINGCNGDDMCPDDEKCCSNGCGALCMKPDSCLEGIVWEEECNTCECINGVPACTKRLCHKEPAPAASAASPASRPTQGTCLEGSVWMKDCNVCDCINGKEVCTRRLCPANVKPIDEVTGECREDSVWRTGCNKCRCIDGRSICTLKQCTPGEASGITGSEGDGDICRMPPVDLAKKACSGFIRRWTFDFSKGKCRRYVYGGCHGTANLFRTKKACKKRCDKKSAQKDGASCRLLVDSGTCFDIIPRYYFDTTANKCIQFGYSGCGGNGNNFENLASCINTCGGTYTSQDTTCDRSRCPWSYYKHYIEQGCEPVYDKRGCCPSRFSCPDSRPSAAASEPCMYRGERYNNTDIVEAASRLDPCKRDCVCRSSPETGPSIECAEVDCPASVWNRISAGCVPLYLPDRCCPVSVSCGSRRRRSTELGLPITKLSQSGHVCRAHGRTYVAGELIPTRGDPCATCVCTPEYSGPDGPGCRRTECLDLTGGRIERDCVPVYLAGACCPVHWKCPEDIQLKDSSVSHQMSDPEPVLTGGVCVLPTVVGGCSERHLRFSYDAQSAICVSFEYSGCGGNGNRFTSLEQCRSACQPTEQQDYCSLSAESGYCYSKVERYFFDVQSGSCKPFTYSGCGGNENNFVTREQCHNKCHPSSVDTKLRSQKQWSTCLLHAEPGPCRSWEVRYYFSLTTGTCQPFKYGGCLGNGNSFRTRQECNAACGRIMRHHAGSAADDHCQFGDRLVRRGEVLDVQEKCTFCECRAPPKLTCRKLYCPQIPAGLESSCRYSQLTPGACCPEMVCDASVDIIPNLSPECGQEQCHLPAAGEGCSVLYRPGECCPEVHCTRPVQLNARLLSIEEGYRCERTKCPDSCLTSHDLYGCVICDCSATFEPSVKMAPLEMLLDVPLSARMAPSEAPSRLRCQRKFCPRGCPSHYDEDGCIVCECAHSRKERTLTTFPPVTPSPTTPRPCPVVTCRPGCGYKRNEDGCTVCDCPKFTTPYTTTTPRPCPVVTCWPGCGYKRNEQGCTVCDCSKTTTPTPPTPPCPMVTCWPGCGHKRNEQGCTVCDCPKTTTPTPPTPPCPMVTCLPGCGYKQDEHGCTLCDCPEFTRTSTTPTPQSCPVVTCWPVCGYKRNEQGCRVCDCSQTATTRIPTPCAPVTCRPGCDRRYSPRGCPFCDCPIVFPTHTTRPPCPSVTCRPECGYKQNPRGCTVCDCPKSTTPLPTPSSSTTPLPTPSSCPPVSCDPGCIISSENGGCPRCLCPGLVDLLLAETRRCPEVRCLPDCVLSAGEDGCARCKCPHSPSLTGRVCPPCPCQSSTPLAAPPPRLSALSFNCPAVDCPARCDVRLDNSGCPVCSCDNAGQPGCARVSCPAGCRTEADPLSGCPSCHCDFCPPCECDGYVEDGRSCPAAVCSAHCPRQLRDGCYQCMCEDDHVVLG